MTFPKYGVRYIAINDNFDSADPNSVNSDFAGIKNWFNEFYAVGKLSDERYEMLSQTYEAEQKQLEYKLVTLKNEIETQEQQIENIKQFIQKAKRYVGIEELTPYALHELISAIYVGAPDKSSGKRRQSIHIKYDGLGFIPLDELLKREKA